MGFLSTIADCSFVGRMITKGEKFGDAINNAITASSDTVKEALSNGADYTPLGRMVKYEEGLFESIGNAYKEQFDFCADRNVWGRMIKHGEGYFEAVQNTGKQNMEDIKDILL